MTQPRTNPEFELSGINHLALVCRDMERTVDFYTNVLGMPLVKTIEFANGGGQHFFFDCGGGDCIAFFWFPDAPEPVVGVSSAGELPTKGDFKTAIGSMNHVALNVPAEKIEAYHRRVQEKGVDCDVILNHDDSEYGVAKENGPGVFIRSLYFFDPDGILLEFAAWTRELTSADVSHTPASVAVKSV